jgi:hypothetical protein
MKPVGFNYPPVIKRGNGTSLMDDLPMKKPPFSARILQLATFDDTGGYSKTGKTIEYPIRYPLLSMIHHQPLFPLLKSHQKSSQSPHSREAIKQVI